MLRIGRQGHFTCIAANVTPVLVHEHLQPPLGVSGRIAQVCSQCSLLFNLPDLPLRVQVVKLARRFAVEAAGFEFGLHPAALSAQGVRVIARCKLIRSHALLVPDVSCQSSEVHCRRTCYWSRAGGASL